MPRIYLTYRPEEGTRDEAQAIARRLEQDWGQGHVSLSPTYDADDILALAEGVRRCDALLMVIGPFWNQLVDEKHRHISQDTTDYQYTELLAALELNMWISVIRLRGAPPIQAAVLPPDLRSLAREDSFSLDMANLDEAMQALKERIRFSRRKQSLAQSAIKPPRPLPPLEDPRRAPSRVYRPETRPWYRVRPLVALALLTIVGAAFVFPSISGTPRPSLRPTLSIDEIRATADADSVTRTAQSLATVHALATRSAEEMQARRLSSSVLASRLAISSDTLPKLEVLQTMRVPRAATPDSYRWIVFSANGRYLFAERSRGLTRYSTADGQAETQSQFASNLLRLAVLNNGNYAALFGDGRIAHVEWTGSINRTPRVYELASSNTSDVASDGELIALGFRDRVVIQRPQGQGWVRARTFPIASRPTIMVANSGRVAVVTESGSTHLFDMTNGETMLSVPAFEPPRPIQAMNLSADGNVIALAYEDWDVEVFSVTGGRVDRFEQPSVRDVALNADGTLIAIASEGNGVVLRRVGDPEQQRVVFYDPGFRPVGINFSPDDRTLVANDNQKVTIYGIPTQ
ncbi:MAG: toll/interleukin-1 receptor domain-containing protein [Anaerolineae bacterium]|nr:toll/interleukin-1 receptor domain-containing protein [Anaerolineae bacterium]MDW8171761.1 hypothetical protein [Anaerolineae bacterium]